MDTAVDALSEHAAVKAARTRLEAAEAALAGAIIQAEAARKALDAFEAEAAEAVLCGNGRYARRNGHLSAVQEADSHIRIAKRALAQAKSEAAEAYEQAFNELKTEYQRRHAEAVKGLARALQMAYGANMKLQQVYSEAEAALGTDCGLEPLHWPELMDGDSRLMNWRRAAGLGGAT